jgi:adenylylsulfate kinase
MSAGKGFSVWFTGLPRSGKSTIARKVVTSLKDRGFPVEFLNSSRIRREMNRSLGFTRDEIETNLRRLGYECRMLNRNGLVAVVTSVSPYRDVREAIRGEVGAFVEVYCRAPMETLMQRDERGLFEKAMRGEIEHVAGINAPYEEPLKPEVLLNTDVDSMDACHQKVMATLEVLGYIDRMADSAYTADEEEMIKDRLRDLGYL